MFLLLWIRYHLFIHIKLSTIVGRLTFIKTAATVACIVAKRGINLLWHLWWNPNVSDTAQLSGCDKLAVVRAVGSRTCVREVHSRRRPQCYCGCGEMWHTDIHYNFNFNPCGRCLFVYLSHVWFNLWIDLEVCFGKLCHIYLRYSI